MLNMLSNPFGGCLRRRPENERVAVGDKWVPRVGQTRLSSGTNGTLVGDKRGSCVKHGADRSQKMAFVSLKIF